MTQILCERQGDFFFLALRKELAYKNKIKGVNTGNSSNANSFCYVHIYEHCFYFMQRIFIRLHGTVIESFVMTSERGVAAL